jgi:NADH:ubiquinone oxidoreductase subunit F (NADH-binding)
MPRIQLRRGAGAYICGEESAMIESIEGKRGMPRCVRPTWPRSACSAAHAGAQLRNPVLGARHPGKGPDWFTSHGRHGRKGLRSFSVSGRVRDPGVKLAPAGITIQELIDEYCGGMQDGHLLRLPAGRRLGRHPAGDDERHPARLRHAAAAWLLHRLGGGGGAVRPDSAKGAARNLLRFFKDESCGQCTPCRAGTAKALAIIEKPVWDLRCWRPVAGDARRLDLRPGPGRAESGGLRGQVLSA